MEYLVLGIFVWGVFGLLSIMDKYYTMKTNLQAQQLLVPLFLWGLYYQEQKINLNINKY